MPALDQTHRAYLRTFDEAVGGSARSRPLSTHCLDLEPLRARVTRLRCFRGIDDLTALTIAAELGDPRRFETAPATMAFVGLVPSEHSSGGKRTQGAITKTFNAHLRRVLVEVAWHIRVIHRRCRSADPMTGADRPKARPRHEGGPFEAPLEQPIVEQVFPYQNRSPNDITNVRAYCATPAGVVVDRG